MLSERVKRSIGQILDENQGLKVVLFDKESAGIVSSVCTMSYLLQKEAFLVDQLKNEARQEIAHFKCICILRPSKESVEQLCKELTKPKYSEYYIYFTNVLQKSLLFRLAEHDSKAVVKDVKECYMDFFPVTMKFFSLGVDVCASKSLNCWREDSLKRCVEGIVSASLCLSKFPIVRFDKSSPMAYRLAEELSGAFQVGSGLETAKQEPLVVLLLDRRSDMLTPLISHWSYLCLLHELLAFNNGKVSIPLAESAKGTQEFSLMADEDEFFAQNAFATFGDLGERIKQYTYQYKNDTKSKFDLTDIQDMRKFIQEYSQYKRMGTNVARHVTLIDNITQIVHSKNLMPLSEVEQSVVAGKQQLQADYANVNRIMPMIEPILQARLLLLFWQRYKNHFNFSALLPQIKQKLQALLPLQTLAAFEHWTEYEQSEPIHCKGGKEAAESASGEASSIYTQHRANCWKIVDALLAGKLSKTQYPYFEANHAQNFIPSPSTMYLVFFVNGGTMEEARIISQFPNVLIGATSVCNFPTLLQTMEKSCE